ncbi:DinB family protein [uncultured Kordia sp.]|uniref:DinB family protein n=1 Tax=uncultured Kordia sp. TaxID=507699 RepID=UPI0026031E2C|nr:DinB family protein [uncultured Kordia sp.]
MTKTTTKLQQLLNKGTTYFKQTPESELSRKVSVDKWSKKEILGHLIDSGINNLQRFTEIQFVEKPYRIRTYHQNELVQANDYQNAETKEIVDFWNALNHRILNVMKQQTEETLNYVIELDTDNSCDLRFLMTDYVEHMEHHLKQILK